VAFLLWAVVLRNATQFDGSSGKYYDDILCTQSCGQTFYIPRCERAGIVGEPVKIHHTPKLCDDERFLVGMESCDSRALGFDGLENRSAVFENAHRAAAGHRRLEVPMPLGWPLS